MWRNARRIGVISGVTAVLAMGLAVPGSAHVTLSEKEVASGSYARIDVRVPNESDEAATVKVEMTLPEDHPLVSVSTKAVPGWTVAVDKRTLDEPVNAHGRDFDEVVSTVTWTADSDETGIGVGEFGEFGLSLGPMPDDVGATLVFKIVQTYSDGEEAPWIEAPEAGRPEPEHPAPVLTVVDGDTMADATSNQAADADTNPDADGRTFPLVLAIVALVLAGIAVTRTRRTTGRSTGNEPSTTQG